MNAKLIQFRKPLVAGKNRANPETRKIKDSPKSAQFDHFRKNRKKNEIEPAPGASKTRVVRVKTEPLDYKPHKEVTKYKRVNE